MALNEINEVIVNQKDNNSVFKRIDLNKETKKINHESGKTSYTFAFLNNNASYKTNDFVYTVDNLGVELDDDGNYTTYILRYIPNMSWFNNPNTDINSYTGEILLLDTNGQTQDTFSLINGEPVENNDSNTSNTANKSACYTYIIRYLICNPNPIFEDCHYSLSINTYCGGGGGAFGGGSSSGGDLGGGGTGDGGREINTNPILGTCHETGTCDEDQIINELEEKALCVYEKLKSSSAGFKNSIKKFEPDFPVAHLKFVADDLDDNTRGETSPPENFVITITLNNDASNSGYDFRPNLLTAKTIIHEVIHAEMFRKMLSLANNNGSIDVTLLNTMLQNGDYTGMLDYYTRYGLNGFQHQQMATHYRETIGRVLQEYDTGIAVADNEQPSQLYLDLAWEGLNHSNITEWQDLTTQEEKDRIDQVISDYISDNENEDCNE